MGTGEEALIRSGASCSKLLPSKARSTMQSAHEHAESPSLWDGSVQDLPTRAHVGGEMTVGREDTARQAKFAKRRMEELERGWGGILKVSQRAPFEEAPCKCVKRHVPKPLTVELHHLYPQAAQRKRYGKVVDSTTIPLCGSAHNNVHEALERRLRGESYRTANRHVDELVEYGYRKVMECDANS